MIYAMGVTHRMQQWHPNAKVRNVELDVHDLKELWMAQDGRCYWSRLPLNPEYNEISQHPFAIIMDRLFDDHYTRQNTVFALRLFNLGRSNFHPAKFAKEVENMIRQFNPSFVLPPPHNERFIEPASLFD